MALEEAWLNVPKVAAELRAESSHVLKHDCHLRPNMSREKARALKELKQDKSRVILTADKGVVMVVLDKLHYINKAQDMLSQREHMQTTSSRPYQKHKNKLINTLRATKAQDGLGDNTCKRL